MIKPSLVNYALLEPNYTNLVDIGIRVNSKGKSLMIAPNNNSFGFTEYSDGFFWAEESIKEYFSESYDFERLDKKS
jgi:hypothetical protein